VPLHDDPPDPRQASAGPVSTIDITSSLRGRLLPEAHARHGGTFVRRSLGDRRRDVRYDIHGDLLATFDSTQQLQIANIGLGGALVYAPSPLPLQSVHTARLVMGTDESDVRFSVRHVAPAEGSGRVFVVGVEFLELSRAALYGIERLLAQSVNEEEQVEGL
jgi:hypothetical protein